MSNTADKRIIETTNCILCGSAPVPRYSVRDQRRGHEQVEQSQFVLGECPRCRFWFLVTRPPLEQIGSYYPTDYYREALIPHLITSNRRKFIERARRRKMLHETIARATRLLSQSGSIVDVGAGSGDFLAAMKARGYSVAGCEFSSEMREFCQRTFNIHLSSGDLLEFHGKEGTYDLITFWESLEHLHPAKDNLLRAHQLLRPGGWVIVSVPNGGSLADKVSQRLSSSAQDFPRHLYVFDARSLRTLLEQCGFTRIDFSYWTSLNGPRWSFVTEMLRERFPRASASAAWVVAEKAFRGASYILDLALSPLARSGGIVVSAAKTSSSKRN